MMIDLSQANDIIREELERIQQKNDEWSKEHTMLMSYQNEGMKLEKSGDISGAEAAYLRCVDYGERSELMKIHNYVHSIERLAVIYRKQKRYADEVKILELALAHQCFPKLEGRINKAKLLKSKTRN